LVVKMRSEGKSKYEIDDAKRQLKYTEFGGSLQKADGRRAQKMRDWKEGLDTDKSKIKENIEKETRKKTERKHEIAIIPIVWRGRSDQQDVLGAAEDIKTCIAQHGIDAWIDGRRHLTPGQKFAHWEFRGVLTRVEVGPEDFANGVCRVCQAKVAGEHESVERRKVRLPPAGNRALLLALKEFGFAKIDIERREGDSADEGEEAGAPQSSAAAKIAAKKEDKIVSTISSEDLTDLAGNCAVREKATKIKTKDKTYNKRT